jgi:hypothetical protein
MPKKAMPEPPDSRPLWSVATAKAALHVTSSTVELGYSVALAASRLVGVHGFFGAVVLVVDELVDELVLELSVDAAVLEPPPHALTPNIRLPMASAGNALRTSTDRFEVKKVCTPLLSAGRDQI